MFPGCPDPNNHTETVLITMLLDPQLRGIPSYLLHLKLTHFYYFIFYHKACDLLLFFLGQLHGICLLWQLHGIILIQSPLSLSLSIYIYINIFQPGYILPCHRPKQLYSLTNKSNTYREGYPTSFEDSLDYIVISPG